MITIDYFSDVLCVWAYGGQIRVDELERTFSDRVIVRQHFVTLFADTPTRIGEGWKQQGGFDGFAEHLKKVCAQWPHTHLHGNVWTRCRPVSCLTSHIFLRAAAIALGADDDDNADPQARARFSQLVMAVRCAFFEQARDIADMGVLTELLDEADLSEGQVRRLIDNGEAHAALHRDIELAKTYAVQGSPTYLFNDGRQSLYGNVGYRIIESNVRELLEQGHVAGEPSWC